MRLDVFRDPELAQRLVADIQAMADRPVQIMEFCGGHTHAIMRYGIRQALAPNVRLLSGPGCPVCVTADVDIDRAIALAHLPGVTVATFGDMIRVPGTSESLQSARAAGADVHIVYSALDAVEMAQKRPEREIVMLGIGFETTAPTVAASLLHAQALGVDNYFVYSMHKLTPPAMRGILDAGEVKVDAVLGPGHVTAITGADAWKFLPDDYGVGCAVSGFEPVDILQAVRSLVRGVLDGSPAVDNDYARSVTNEGNLVAQRMLSRAFVRSSASWRGLSEIPESGLAIAPALAEYDAAAQFELPDATESLSAQDKGCLCGEVLRGVIEPTACPLFGTVCNPAHPVGPCMVSAEGTCAAHFRYGGEL